MHCIVVDLGQMEYRKTLALQEQLCALRAKDEIEDVLLLGEHNPVITLGRTATKEMFRVSPIEIRKKGIDIIEIDRGGNCTYHGPGQLVGYPILDFTCLGISVDQYMKQIREMLVLVLREFGISSWEEDGGVWVSKELKIGATGVAIKTIAGRKITKHGFALDVATQLEHFAVIDPCGHTHADAVSMEKLLQKKVEMATIKQCIINLFGDAFGHSLEIQEKDELMKRVSMQ